VREFVQQIHFVGIGGVGMSGIASVLLDQGYRVSGSDLVVGPLTRRLADRGAVIDVGHEARHITGADVVVVSTAVSTENVEVEAARNAGIPVIPRAEMLAELMRFRRGIAIAGTHGKTTTTSLIAGILATAGLDPTFLVGGVVNSVRGYARLGTGEWLIAEADESDASFLCLDPYLAVVTNIDADHLENFDGEFENLIDVFVEFLQRLPFYGLAILCVDDPVVQRIRARVNKPIVTYGTLEDAEYRATDIRPDGPRMVFNAHLPGRRKWTVDLALAGEHNVLNALAAIALADQIGIAQQPIRDSLAGFEGIGRRFEILGEIAVQGGSAVLVDDYAHHPREIEATLGAARGCWPERRRVVVFQPHRYSRLHDLFDEFADLLAGEECLIVTEVYAAGETPVDGVDGGSLCEAIRSRGGRDPVFLSDVRALAAQLEGVLLPGDVVLTLGAGDIGRVVRECLTFNRSVPEGGGE